MISRVFQILFGCRHKHLGRPVTPKKQAGGSRETYIVCLDCGKRLAYDLKSMTVGKVLDN